MKLLSSIFALTFGRELTADKAINVCYYTNWSQYRPGNGKFKPESIDPNLCTHINYAFSFVEDDGTDIRTFEWNDATEWGTSMYKEVNNMKLVNSDLKVILSVGGWTHGTGGFHKAAKTKSSRETFARNALKFIQKYDFDGIDIDWEYPGFTNHPTKPGTEEDVMNHVYLLEELKDVFKPEGLLVTGALGAPPSRVDESYPDTKRICDTLDYVHLMTYDMHGGWESVIGHHSPFTSDGKHPTDPTNTWNVKSSVDYWIEKGCPAHKLTMGLGAYGRVFKATGRVDRLEPGTAKGVRGTYTREDGYMSYYELCNWKTHIDQDLKSAVAINGQNWAGYETVESANVKLDYVINRGLAGIMWWSLDLDDFSGTFCGQGKYPLISGVWSNLKKKLDGDRPVPTVPTDPETTTETKKTTDRPAVTTETTETPKETTKTPQVTEKPDTGLSNNEYCKKKGDGLWASPKSCDSYIQCVHGGIIAVERKCGSGLLWNPERGYCDWETNVVCQTVDQTKPTDTTTETATDAPTTQNTSKPDKPTTTTVKSDWEPNCDGVSQNGYRSYEGDCSKFIQCWNGRPFVKTCAAGLVWNKERNYCDWKYNVPEC